MPSAASTRLNIASAARLFHALSDETRLSVLASLNCDECCVCDLTDALDVAQPLLSFHLKVLKEAGLVTDRREGRWVHYSINDEAFVEAKSLLASLKPKPRKAALPVSACCG